MADSILKLKVDNQEYDSKLKRATEGLQRYVDGCRKAGGTLAVVEDETLQFVQALGNMDTVAKGGQQSLKEMTRSLTDLTIQYRSLTDEEKNSPFGQALAKGIDQLTERAAVAKDAMGDVNAAITRAASDTRAFDQIAGATSLVTSSFQTLQGTAKLLGIDLGDNVEVIARLQAAMAVTNGLTQIQNALQKESAVMQGVVAIRARANAAAQALLAKNTAAATAAGKAFNIVAKANPYVLIASAIVAAGTALVAFSRHSREAAEETKKNEEAINRAKKATQEYQSTLASEYANMMSKYDELKRAWLSLGTEAEKMKWIKDNQQAFANLALNVQDLKTAEDVFEQNTSSVIDGFRRRAEAAAIAANMVELYRQKMQVELSASDRLAEKRVSAYDTLPSQYHPSGGFTRDQGANTFNEGRYGINNEGKYYFTAKGAAEYNRELFKTDQLLKGYNDEWAEINKKIENSNSRLMELAKTNTQITSGPADSFAVGSLPQLTQQLKDLRDAQSKALNPQEWVQYQQQIEQTQYQIEAFKGQWRDGLQATFTINDSEIMDQFRQVKGIVLDEKTMTITVNTAEAYNQVRSLTSDIEDTTVQFKIQPELARGLSITTSAGLNAYIAQLKQQINQADLGSDLYNGLTSKLADANMLQNLVKESLSAGLGTALFDIADENGQDFWDRVLSPEGVEDADWQAIADAINKKRKELGLDAITIDVNTGDVSSSSKKKESKESELLDTSKNLVNGLSQVTSGLDQMGMKVSDGTKEFIQTAQGAMSVIEGVKTVAEIITGSTASSLVSTGISLVQALIANTTALFSNTAATTAAAATEGADMAMDVVKVGAMIMMAAHGGVVPRAATGYTVPGTHYSGDVTPVLANAGEVILNRAQQGNLVSQLEETDGTSEGGYARPFVTGQDIFLGINNYLRGAGYGELITTKTLRQRGII